MRKAVYSVVVTAVGLLLAGCASGGVDAAKATGPASLLVTESEAAAHGGWTVSADSGPAAGETSDCTGAPFAWPKLKLEGHASQFLDKGTDDSIAVVAKHFDGKAAANVKALRDALAPCSPASGALPHGAMITPVGDDSFAYQTQGKDKSGAYVLNDLVVGCGVFELEAIRMSYADKPDEAGLEDVLSGAIGRLLKAGNCVS